MDEVIADILQLFRTRAHVDAHDIERVLQLHNREAATPERAFSKKDLLPFLYETKKDRPEVWKGWGITPQEEERLTTLLRVKPRRTSSGVATITVITKPWTCSSACIYCPNDVRMPKSYLANEPACQRAERNCFDPYLQVASRLHVLQQMGHETDKLELIVLGGTWTDYPRPYQMWFMEQLFKAANEFGSERGRETVAERWAYYREMGISANADEIAQAVESLQDEVTAGSLGFNEAIQRLYGQSAAWQKIAEGQHADIGELEQAQRINETTAHRVVGLVVETRPDAITPEVLVDLRRFGCTKVQMGIQSLDEERLLANGRHVSRAQIAQAFALLRLFGFKIHVHAMVNLVSATPEDDIADYRELVSDPAFLPDEVKLYPCVLVRNSDLYTLYEQGQWRAYSDEDLKRILVEDIAATPPYTRISRMIRDISAGDIIAGNKKTNLRQMVEKDMADEDRTIREIRHREVNHREVADETLSMEDYVYDTTVSQEHFLQWVTPEGAIAGFLRLSLPKPGVVEEQNLSSCCDLLSSRNAMIREVHVYGSVAPLSGTGNAQHRGLGRALVQRACEIAQSSGYDAINVISAIGTRQYYRNLGFEDAGLYQRKPLVPAESRTTNAPVVRSHANHDSEMKSHEIRTSTTETQTNRASATEQQPAHANEALPTCPVFGTCGACQLLNVPYEKQLADKDAKVAETFGGLLDSTEVFPILGMDNPYHYRHKVISPFAPHRSARNRVNAASRASQSSRSKKLPHDRADHGGETKKRQRTSMLTGMYVQGTHRLVSADACLLEDETAKQIIAAIRKIAEERGIQPYDEDTGKGFLRHAQIRVGHSSGEVLVTLVTNEKEFPASKSFCRELIKRCPAITSVVQNVNHRQTNVILGPESDEKTLYGPGFILDKLCGLSFRISSHSFYQVNAIQTEVLYRRAVELANLTGTETVIDAYCGTGTIGLIAARSMELLRDGNCSKAENGNPNVGSGDTAASVERQSAVGGVIGVDRTASAIHDARQNVRHNGITNARFEVADAGDFLRNLAKEERLASRIHEHTSGKAVASGQTAISDQLVVFLDPPRAGASEAFLEALVTLQPQRVVYISCNIETQARDIAYLTKHGYRLTALQPVDMFPHTPHIEAVALMTKANRIKAR